MKLAESDIKPGIYRHSAGFPYGPPGLEKHLEWCSQNGREPTLKSIKETLDDALFEHGRYLKKEQGVPSPHFFPTPSDFLKAWQEGYRIKGRRSILSPRSKGFELQFVTWDESSPYYRIERDGKVLWEAVRDWGVLDGIVIATDINGITDQYGYMCLGVNDLDTQRILAYKPKNEISEENRSKWRKNTFIAEEDIYVTGFIDGRKPEFPYTSIAPDKTGLHTWIMIGFSPHDVYNALRKLGFIFPK